MTKEDQQLPFSGHIVSAFQHFYCVQDFIVVVFVRTQKVIVCNPQSKVIVGTVDVVKSVCFPVGRFIGSVQALDHLLEWTELFGNRIVVGKPNHLGNAELEGITKFMEELLGSQWIGTVTVCDKAEVFWKLFEMSESHAHCHDTGTDAAVVRDLVTDDNQYNAMSNTVKTSMKTTAKLSRKSTAKYVAKRIAATKSWRNNRLAVSGWSSSAKFSVGTGVSNTITSVWTKVKKWFLGLFK